MSVTSTYMGYIKVYTELVFTFSNDSCKGGIFYLALMGNYHLMAIFKVLSSYEKTVNC